MPKLDRTRGFTLVELMVVLAIIAIVATIAIANMSSATKAGNEVAAVKALRIIAEAEGTYRKVINPGSYALALTDLMDGPRAMVPPDIMAGESKGYRFVRIPADETGALYTADVDFAFCAYPVGYNRTGNNTFIIGVEGTVYHMDTGGAAVTQWPAANPIDAGWDVTP